MGVVVDEFEVSCSIPPKRLFKAFVLDSDNLLPKIMPSFFKSWQTLEGDGGAGTVKLLTFQEGDQIKTSKHRTDAVDETNHVFKFTVIEGGLLDTDDFEALSQEVKIEPGPNGGSIYKGVNTYNTKGENHHRIQEIIKQSSEGTKAFLHAVEAHLTAHPEEYN